MHSHLFSYPKQCDYVYNDEHIDIWQYSLAKEEDNAHLLLNKEELARANRYYFEKHRRRFITARLMLRAILGRYLKINPKLIEFTHNEYGKPSVLQAQDLQFNLSHSGDVALLAIGKTHPLGIDLEFFSARPYMGIAKQMFSLNEQEAFQSVVSFLKPLIFFHVWAQKEAFIKACGMGLSYPTQTFDVPLSHPTHQTIWDAHHKVAWKISSFMPSIQCAGAICYHPSIQNIRYYFA